MLGKLILLFVLVPLADMLLLMTLSKYTGVLFSIGMVVLSGIVGAWLAKRSYRSMWHKAQTNLAAGQASPELLSDGAMIFFAAGLLLTPGFITDAVGFSLLIPVCRRWYKSWLVKWFKRNFNFQIVTFDGRRTTTEDGVVDGEVVAGSQTKDRESGEKIAEDSGARLR